MARCTPSGGRPSQMSSIFQSEDECDIWCHENLEMPERGFYVDVGCSHPKRYSQTHWLRRLGWRGLAIDASWQTEAEWKGVADVQFLCAVVLDGQPTRFLNEPTNTLVSRVHPEGEFVQTLKLSGILAHRNIRRIDFMAIDVENSEPVVLRDIFEWGFFPTVLIAEYNSEHVGRNPETIMIPIQAGYKLVHLTNSNAVFVLQK